MICVLDLIKLDVINMSISNFTTKEGPPQIDHTIKQLFANRIHKKIPIDRSDFA